MQKLSNRIMRALPVFVVAVLSFIFVDTGFADSKYLTQPSANSQITINKYYAAKCNDYTGTWTGMSTDPTDLFANGGPWPVTVNLSYLDGHIVGTNVGSPTKNTHIWAQCENGVLFNIFWANKKTDCGDFSQSGMLISKNVMLISLQYENAMNGANFITVLQRAKTISPMPAPKTSDFLDPKSVQSCH